MITFGILQRGCSNLWN
ncbi:hypothetical protein RDI58_004925 [Solanum bulbocastanum]|uniref:Uncharacterized protein n=1 Tax=Solanum bulbocastanum TaxID=147425 RepID=A0AAN8TYI5_SOLBU